MKPKIFTAVLLFISAYSPLFLILIVKDFNFQEYRFGHPIAIAILFGVTLLSVVLLFLTVNRMSRGNMCVEIVSVKNRSVDLINYTIPYMIAFFGADLSKPADIISVSIFLLILLLLTITSKSVFINPVLAIAGYGLYDLDYKFDGKIFSTTVISRHDMRTSELFHIRSLTRFLYFVTELKSAKNEQ